MVLPLVCADIMHTQGATDYAFLSFLSVALRLRKELGTRLAVRIPEGLGWLDMRRLYTAKSFVALAASADIVWDYSHTCDHSNFDIRIANTIRTRGVLLSSRHDENRSVIPQYDHRHHPHPLPFFTEVWAYLRAELLRASSEPVLRISFALLQATDTVWSHAAAVLHPEAMQVVSTLEFSPGEVPSDAYASSLAHGRPCGYVFFSLKSVFGAVKLRPAACAGDACRHLDALEHQFRLAAAKIVELHAEIGLDCAYVNAVVDTPESEAKIPRLFAEESARIYADDARRPFEARLLPKPQKHRGDFTNMVQQRRDGVALSACGSLRPVCMHPLVGTAMGGLGGSRQRGPSV